MLDKIMTALRFPVMQDTSTENYDSTRRNFPRRLTDKCVSVVNGTTLPVLDWSPGGLRVFADNRPVAIGDEMDVVLKFQVRDEMINITHRAHVVRKARDSFAMQFLPLTSDIRHSFNQIIDNFNADAFASSQA